MTEAVYDDAIDEVNCLPRPGQVHLGPVVLAGGGVDVAGGRGGGDASVAEVGVLKVKSVPRNRAGSLYPAFQG